VVGGYTSSSLIENCGNTVFTISTVKPFFMGNPMNHSTENEPALTEKQASRYQRKIANSVGSVRVAIYEMWSRRGYEALEYSTWEEFVETLSINPGSM
jgi:hypothetical protein